MNINIKYVSFLMLFASTFEVQIHASNLIDSVEALKASGVIFHHKLKCKKPIRCQFYKFCAERYNAEYGIKYCNDFLEGSALKIPKEDALPDCRLREELKILAGLISFFDKDNRIIEPVVNTMNGNIYIPFLKSQNECVDYKIVMDGITWFEKISSNDESLKIYNGSGLIEGFLAFKKNQKVKKANEENIIDCLPCVSNQIIDAVPPKCIRAITCQFKKFCAERYNAEYGTSIKTSGQDEIQDNELREELRALANIVSFRDKDGLLVQPFIDKQGDTHLPECVDSRIVKHSVLWYEYIFGNKGFNSCGPLGIIPTFEFLKKNYDQKSIELENGNNVLYCLPCISSKNKLTKS